MRAFSVLLKSRIAELDTTVADVARRLTEDRGIRTSRQSVDAWADGTYRPESWKWSALLDTLGVTGADREEWRAALEAAPAPGARPEADDPSVLAS
jgi:hypothetical protein